MASRRDEVQGAPAGFGTSLKKIGLVIASALVTINIWTGAPLLSVWVGSKIQGSSTNLSMGAVFAVIVLLAALVVLLAWLLGNINAAYDDLTGRPHKHRQTSPWLRSMRGEREHDLRQQAGISPVERMVVISVVLAALAFEVWFFFFAGSSLPNQ
jgi:hypothetical protein